LLPELSAFADLSSRAAAASREAMTAEDGEGTQDAQLRLNPAGIQHGSRKLEILRRNPPFRLRQPLDDSYHPWRHV